MGVRYFLRVDQTAKPVLLVRVTDAAKADRLLAGPGAWEPYDELLRLVYQDPDMSFDEVDLSTADDAARRLGGPPGILGMAAV